MDTNVRIYHPCVYLNPHSNSDLMAVVMFQSPNGTPATGQAKRNNKTAKVRVRQTRNANFELLLNIKSIFLLVTTTGR